MVQVVQGEYLVQGWVPVPPGGRPGEFGKGTFFFREKVRARTLKKQLNLASTGLRWLQLARSRLPFVLARRCCSTHF